MSMGGDILTRARARESSIEITITRADGRIEHLGTVAYWHRNPLRRFAWHARQKLKGIINGCARSK